MKVYAISDLHLSLSGEKPMDIFGDKWQGYLDKIKYDWQAKVTDDDVVLIAGDISWGMQMQETQKDFDFITVKEICEKAGVNRSTFYLHYDTIDDLFQETISNLNNDFINSFKIKDVTSLIKYGNKTGVFLVACSYNCSVVTCHISLWAL